MQTPLETLLLGKLLFALKPHLRGSAAVRIIVSEYYILNCRILVEVATWLRETMIFLIHLLRKNETFIENICNENSTRKKLYANPREHSGGGSYSMLTGGGFASDEKSKYLFNLGIFGFGYFISSYVHEKSTYCR